MILIICIVVVIVILLLHNKYEKNNELNEQDYQALKRQSLETKAENLLSMNGYDFEQYVAQLLKDANYSDVIVTKSSGDYGIDVLASKDGIRYAIQCKRYSEPVGNHAVQEAFSGKAYYGADLAVVVTNSTFTETAKQTAEKIGVLLWDKDTLESLIRSSKNMYCRYCGTKVSGNDNFCSSCGKVLK